MESSITIGEFNRIMRLLAHKEIPCLKKSFITETLANLTFNLLKNQEEDYGIKITMIDVVASELDVYDEYVAILDKLMEKEAN